jgi:predicted dehydrogenase
MFGLPESVYASVDKISDLDIETDDNVDIVIKYKNGLRVMIHLDLYGRPHEKYISVTGDNGTLEWSFDPNRIRYTKSIEHNWEEYNFNLERNDMFVNVVKEFIKVIDGHLESKCTIDEGVSVMRIIEACRKSSNEKKVVVLNEI